MTNPLPTPGPTVTFGDPEGTGQFLEQGRPYTPGEANRALCAYAILEEPSNYLKVPVSINGRSFRLDLYAKDRGDIIGRHITGQVCWFRSIRADESSPYRTYVSDEDLAAWEDIEREWARHMHLVSLCADAGVPLETLLVEELERIDTAGGRLTWPEYRRASRVGSLVALGAREKQAIYRTLTA